MADKKDNRIEEFLLAYENYLSAANIFLKKVDVLVDGGLLSDEEVGQKLAFVHKFAFNNVLLFRRLLESARGNTCDWKWEEGLSSLSNIEVEIKGKDSI